jgi:hypothetical protein
MAWQSNHKNKSRGGAKMAEEKKKKGLPPHIREQISSIKKLFKEVGNLFLEKDLLDAAKLLTPAEIRFMVDQYYQIQESRKASSNQTMSLLGSQEPHGLFMFVLANLELFEHRIGQALAAYSASKHLGQWAESITGIGPIISAGLMAHIDIKLCPTVGHIWSFAGLDPQREWLGREKAEVRVNEIFPGKKTFTQGDVRVLCMRSDDDEASTDVMPVPFKAQRIWDMATKDVEIGEAEEITRATLVRVLAKRPWNASLKVLCWKIGESFVKFSGNKEDIYGKIYIVRKVLETTRNEAFQFRDQAIRALAEKNYGKDTEAYKWYAQGMLPPARIHARAKRYAVKLFLSHWHHVAYEIEFGRSPEKPYIFTRPEHTHFIGPPHWPMVFKD